MRVNEAKTGYTLNRSRTLEILWMRVNEAKTGYTLNRSRTLEVSQVRYCLPRVRMSTYLCKVSLSCHRCTIYCTAVIIVGAPIPSRIQNNVPPSVWQRTPSSTTTPVMRHLNLSDLSSQSSGKACVILCMFNAHLLSIVHFSFAAHG